MTDWKHDDLAADLAHWLRHRRGVMAFLDVACGKAEGAPERLDFVGKDMTMDWGAWDAWNKAHPQGRADVFTVPMTSNPQRLLPHVFEIKVRRADFLADVRALKYRRYFEMGAQVSFAALDGMIRRQELPAGCGLIVRRRDGRCFPRWRVVRGAPVNRQMRLTFDQVTSLLRACHSQLAGDGFRKKAVA